MHRTTKQALDALLLQVVDGGLAGVIFLVPFLMGGRHAVGQLILTVLAVIAACAWAVRQCLCDDTAWRPTRAAPLLVAGLGLVVLQTIPLSPAALAFLSPQAAEMLPLWNLPETSPTALGCWSCVSFAPAETQAGLVLFLDFILLFFVTLQRIRHIEDIERLLRWCALSATCMAGFGIVQYFSSNGKFFWFYQHPFSSTFDVIKGSFTNRNHFANFLALGIGPLIWWIQDTSRSRHSRRSHKQETGRLSSPVGSVSASRPELPTYLLALALGVVAFAGLLSLSRGGIASMFLAATIGTVACYWMSTIGGRFLVALGAVGLLIVASLAIFGFDRVSKRLDDFAAGSLERLDSGSGRRTIWTAAAKTIPNFLPLGTGVGSFREVYPMYLDAVVDEDFEFTHAENSPLQVAVETGMIGLGLVLAGIVFCTAWCIGGVRPSNATRLRTCTVAIAASLAASVAHSLVDFVWYVPACMAIVAILAACAQRAAQLSGEGRGARSERKVTSDQWSATSETNHKSEIIDVCLVNEPASNPIWLFFRPAIGRPRIIGRANVNRNQKCPRPSPFAPHPSSLAWMATAAAFSIVGFWMITNDVGPAAAQPYWDEYLIARHTAQNQLLAKNSAMTDAAVQRRWIACLENTIRWQPTHPRASLALAETHRRLFDILQTDAENQMSLANIRDAAMQSRFSSRKALEEWLLRAIGKHWIHLEQAFRYTRRAMAITPLQGRGYVYLADLAFLYGADATAQKACLQQAMRVRPYDGAVLYATAGEALLAGDADQWLSYAKLAYKAGPRQQRQFISDMANAAATEKLPEVIDFILREFQPNLPCLRLLYNIAAKRCSVESLTPLIQHRAQKAEAETADVADREAAQLWIEAQRLHSRLQNDADALRCARQAVRCDAGNYEARFQLASCLVEQAAYTEAEPHLRWCLHRKPDDKNAENKFREALKGRLDSPRRAAAEDECLR